MTRIEELRDRAAKTLAAASNGAVEQAEEVDLLREIDRNLEVIADKATTRALLDARNLADEQDRARAASFRAAAYRFGDGARRAGIVFRQPTIAEVKEMGSAKTDQERMAINRKYMALCILWHTDSAERPTLEDVTDWIDGRAEVYPTLWAEAVSAWMSHTEATREESRGKV